MNNIKEFFFYFCYNSFLIHIYISNFLTIINHKFIISKRTLSESMQFEVPESAKTDILKVLKPLKKLYVQYRYYCIDINLIIINVFFY